MTFFFSMNVQASHLTGITINLQYAGSPNTYLVKATLYRDCAGITAPNSIGIRYGNGFFYLQSTLVVTLPLVNQQFLNPYTCSPINPINCNLGNGVEMYEYLDTVVLPNAGAEWHFWYSNCCRSAALPFTSSSSGSFYGEAILNNLNYPTNSLPEFASINAPYFCVNQPAVFPNYATDADGDSIVYNLISAREMNGISTPLNSPYSSPYSATNFISSSAPITFDTLTGIASFTPNLLQSGVIVVLASEYRNGVFIGSVMREISLTVVNGIYNPSLVSGNVFMDFNNDGINNGTDYGLKNIFLQSNPFYAFNVTDSNGNYGMYIGAGPHSVSIATVAPWFSVSPASYNFNFSTAGNTSNNNDFAVYPIPGTTDLSLTMTAQRVRPLVESTVNLSVKNLGSDLASGVLVLTLPDSVYFDTASETPASIVGNLITWNITPLVPLQHHNIVVSVIADSSLVIGDSVYFEASLTSSLGTDVNPSNNLASGWVDVINSFDPNIKTVFPNGTVPQSAILLGQPLTYRIEFENTGNANALTVRLTDILPAEVKLNSIEILAASHAYITQIIYPRQLEFTFNGINLPPTSIDPNNSKGYIIFKVTPENNLNVGTVIANEAKIYFDNNTPVITPMAEVVVVGTTGIVESNNASSNTLFIYPNPTHDRINIEMPGAGSGKFAVSLYSIDGKLINALSIQKQKEQPLQLDLSLTEKGIYIIIVSKDSRVWSSKVVRN